MARLREGPGAAPSIDREGGVAGVPCSKSVKSLSGLGCLGAGSAPEGAARESAGGWLLETVGDAAAGEVVGRKLDLDPVAGQDADVELAHFAGNVGQHFVTVFQLDAEHGVGQGFLHHAVDLNGAFFGHKLYPPDGAPHGRGRMVALS